MVYKTHRIFISYVFDECLLKLDNERSELRPVAYLGFGKGGAKFRGSGGRKSSSVGRGRSRPPKAGAFLKFYIHNFDATLQ